MKIFIIGITGIIGKSIAQKFVCEGYEVYGLTRKKENKKYLLEEEIIPIIGDISDIDIWFKEVEDCNIFINCYTYFENDSNRVLKKIVNLSKKKINKKLYIYLHQCFGYMEIDLMKYYLKMIHLTLLILLNGVPNMKKKL